MREIGMALKQAYSLVVAGSLALGLAACATANKGYLVALDDTSRVAKTRTILAVTTRMPVGDDPPGELFNGDRGGQLHYVSLNLSLPPNREAGAVPAEAGRPDPARHIALVSSRALSQSQFEAMLKTTPFARRRALVFTHGFNTQFDDAVIRFAQIVEDTSFSGIPVLFSWPSRGSLSAYGYDKDSANFSRDGMETLLATLARERNIAGVDIFAHSMGNWLTLETLRQIAIGKDQTTLDRLGSVVLAAPDVDMDVFRTQVTRLGALRSRIVLYASRDDFALRASRRLFGDKIRAGENTDLAQFEALGIKAHDLSDVKGGVGKNHGKAFGDPETIAQIGGAMARGSVRSNDGSADPVSSGIALLGRSVTAVGDAITAVGR